MQQIIYFIKKFKYFLLFVFLEFIAFVFTFQHHSYHKSKFVNSANFITGGIYNELNSITEYLNLKSENKLLIEENTHLKNLLEQRNSIAPITINTVIDTVKYFQKYEYTVAKIINNNYTKRNNILTLNKGTNQGVTQDLGVINGKGVIGVIKNVSSNYATVISILNSYSKINVRLKNNTHYGTLVWDGNDYNTVQITDMPRQAKIKLGDTVITGGKSTIFPEGIPIGVIKNFEFKSQQYKKIDVALFNDMSAISNVQIVKNLQREEQKSLEQKTENE
ncbi:rod shape-determining protein MreC [Lutibacter sp.]